MKKDYDVLLNKFENQIYCNNIISNNAGIYEIQKLISNKDINYSMSFSRGLFYIAYIEKVVSQNVQDISEVKNYYQNKQNQYKLINKENKKFNIDYLNHFDKQKKTQQDWRKINLEYYIIDNGKKIFLRDYDMIRKQQIQDQIRICNSQKQGDSLNNSTDISENKQNKSQIKILNGIYFLIDFLEMINSKSNQNHLEQEYINKMLEFYNISTIYGFIVYFITRSISQLIQNKFLVDLDIRNFILIYDNSEIKFVYLANVEQFIIHFEQQFQANSQLDYGQLCQEYYFNYSAQDQNKARTDIFFEIFKFNEKFLVKFKQLIQQIGKSILSESDKTVLKDECDFSFDCFQGTQSIEDIFQHEDYQQFCKLDINKNCMLTAIKNNQEVYKIFKILYDQEQRESEELTKTEILNSFLQDALKRNRIIQNPNNQQISTIFNFVCEEFPKILHGVINQGTQKVKSQTPESIQKYGKFHEIQSLTNTKREMQILLKIKEEKYSPKSEIDLEKDINVAKGQVQELEQQMKKEKSQNKEKMEEQQKIIKQIKEKIKQAEDELNHLNNITLSGDKNILIEFKENPSRIQIKFYFLTELIIQSCNIDEMLYLITLFNNHFHDISLYMDDQQRVFFQSHLNLGYNDQSLMNLIRMIDSIIIYAMLFKNFYYQSIMYSRQSHDLQKYTDLKNEIQHYLKAYQFQFNNFKISMKE